MPRRGAILGVTFLAAALLAATVMAQRAPRITNGRVTTRPASGAFVTAVRAVMDASGDVTLIGYTVPSVDGRHVTCCGHSDDTGARVDDATRSCCGGCGGETRSGLDAAGGSPIELEAEGRMIVILRVEERQATRIRLFPDGCTLDAGGRAVVWFDGVAPAESVALLESFVVGDAAAPRAAIDGALTALALHRDGSADAALERMVAPAQPEAVRRKTAFWLGTARGARGLAVLERVLRDDPSLAVRKGAVFGVSQSREPAAMHVLVSLARKDPEPRIRSEALFWMAQKAGGGAGAAITDRIENDPDTDVKKRAVFALSRLPNDEGVPLLIAVARTNTNPVVRKQAMFWLGQSNDARAVSFFEEILARREP